MTDGYTWYDREPFRRIVLSRFLRRKTWHPTRLRFAVLRYLYWTLIRGYECETCRRCGGPVRVVFHVPDGIWETVTGYGPRSPGGESAPGVLCPPCVSDLAKQAGLPFLRWTCATDDSGLRG